MSIFKFLWKYQRNIWYIDLIRPDFKHTDSKYLKSNFCYPSPEYNPVVQGLLQKLQLLQKLSDAIFITHITPGHPGVMVLRNNSADYLAMPIGNRY